MDKLNTAGNILTLVGELLCKPFRAREKAREEQTAFRSELTSRLDRISETLRGVSEDIGDLQYERLSQAQDFVCLAGVVPRRQEGNAAENAFQLPGAGAESLVRALRGRNIAASG